MPLPKITLGACGSTERTVQCLEALLQSKEAQFQVRWVITPPPKPVGRKQILTPSPVELWAKQHDIEVRHVRKKLSEIQEKILAGADQHPIDVLLVVDFGYIIPQWLLDLPQTAPINVHPSDLPKYRGSSPAQYALLAGETESAVCIMRLVWELDAGPVINRLPFAVPPTMTQSEYYETAFALASAALPQTIVQYLANHKETPQPIDSPTAIAGRLTREDGALGPVSFQNGTLTKLDGSTFDPIQLDRMVRALSPWPGVWGIVPNYKNRSDVRLKILAGELSPEQTTYLVTQWQYDGEAAQNTFQ